MYINKKANKKSEKLTIVCTKCEKEKDIKEFYDDSLHCKKCHSNYVQSKLEQNTLEFLEDCIVQNIIKSNELSAARLLLLSCKSRYEACKYNKNGYEHIKCDYDSYFDFFFKLIAIDDLWIEWKKQSIIHKQTAEQSDRPTLDRVDPLLNYTLDNLQVLSLKENVLKARQKASKALVYRNGDLIGKFRFDSKKQFYEEFNNYYPSNVLNSIKFDTATFQKLDKNTYLLLQTDSIDRTAVKVDGDKYVMVYESGTTYYFNQETMKLLDVKNWTLSKPIKHDVGYIFID